MKRTVALAAALLALTAAAESHPYGGITFSGTFDIDGIGRVSDYTLWPETYPTQYHVKAVLDEGQYLFAYSVPDDPRAVRYPLMDESLWIMPPAQPGQVMTVEAIPATAQFWVNPVTGSDSNAGSRDAPFKTLRKAVSSGSTAEAAYTVVHAAAGEYTEGTSSADKQSDARLLIDRRVRVKGAGRGLSFIRGEKDTTSGKADDYGCGSNAVRCVQFSTFSHSCVQGFTLADGYSDLSTSTDERKKGGIVCKGAVNQICDCSVTNCFGYNGSAGYHGSFIRSIVSGCDMPATTCLASSAQQNLYVICSVVRKRSNSGSSSVVDYTVMHQSTVTGDWISPEEENGAYGFRVNTVATNCILGAGSRSITSNGGVHGNLIWSASGLVSAFWETNTRWGGGSPNKSVPLLYDVFGDDPAPLSISPVIGAGMMHDDYYRTYSADVNGDPVLFVNAKPTLGAVQTTMQTLIVPAGAEFASLSIEGVSSITNGVREGDTVTLTLTDATRPGGSFIINGEKIPGPSYTFTAGKWNDTSVGNPFTISSVEFSGDWYVDAVNGDDANSGFYPGPAHARKTLCSVLTNKTEFLEGDTLHAAAGIYDEGKTLTYLGWTRCSVDEERHVIADEGPEKTFIVGAASEDETKDSDGCGPGAVRCVTLGKNSTLSGFTLTGGRTDLSTASDGYKSGGAAYNNPAATLSDCIISNNVSTDKGGAVRGGTLVNCRVFDNASSGNNGIMYGMKLYGCIIDRNRSNQILPDCNTICNCTIGPNNLNYAGTAAAWCIYYPQAANIVANTICLGHYGSASGREIIATNSVFANCADNAAKFITLEGTSYVTNKGAAVLDDDYSLLPECTDLVDGGDPSFISDIYAGKDAFGSQRVYNGAIDIGAVETDWREVYKSIFAPSAGFTMKYASPSVYAGDASVCLPDGASLEIEWSRSLARAITTEVLATVSGAGTLSIFRNGVLVASVTSSSSEKTTFKTSQSENTLRFSFEGEGVASLKSLSSTEKGFILILK